MPEMLPNAYMHALLFLSLNRDKMSQYLPEAEMDFQFVIAGREGQVETKYPSKAALIVCLECFYNCPDLELDESQRELIEELRCCIYTLFWAAGDSNHPYFFSKTVGPINGLFVGMWDVMRRLSREMLATLKLDVSESIVPFQKFMGQVWWERIPAPPEEDADLDDDGPN